VLLFFQVGFFLILPVETPLDWRALNRRRGMSERFLAFVQSIDGRANCFPSMHCSVASMTALYLTPHTLLAEEERDLISRRTKEGLAAHEINWRRVGACHLGKDLIV
jgi:hypothetical protein